MKKIIFGLILGFGLIATSCVSTSNSNKNIKLDSNNCLRGKYNIYSTVLLKNEKFLEIVKRHPLVVDSKYDLISNLPPFYTFEWNMPTNQTIQVKYINYDKSGEEKDEFRNYSKIAYDLLGNRSEIVEMQDFRKMLEEIQTEMVFVDTDVRDVMHAKGLSLDKAILEVRQTRKNAKIIETQTNYKFQDLIDWMCGDRFDSTLPEPKTIIYVDNGLFVSEKVGNGAYTGYLVYCAYGHKKIFIIGENLKTEIASVINWGTGFKNALGLQGGFQMEYTGKSVVELSNGSTINAPIFIVK